MSGVWLSILLAATVAYVRYEFILSTAFYRKRMKEVKQEYPISVIVCFRNEAAVLADCIEGILRQDYPDFELLLVDDHSTDGSPHILSGYKHATRLRPLKPPPTRPGKKDALAYGIRMAAHERLLLTDADCVPASDQWLRLMAGPLNTGSELVLGYSPYGGDDRLLHRWQRFEALHTARQYLGYAYARKPYMGVGRNLGYTKSFFRRAGGFAAHADLPGGDDDLLIAGNARPGRSKRMVEPDAFTISRPSNDWATYLRRKLRHQSVGTRYPREWQWRLGLFALWHGAFYLSLAALLVGGLSPWLWPVAVVCYLVRVGLLGLIDRSRLDISLPLLLVFDAAMAPFYLFLAAGTIFVPRRW